MQVLPTPFHYPCTCLEHILQPSEMSEDECRSPIGLDCCSCCLDLANGIDDSMGGSGGPGLGALPGSPTSPTVTHFRQLRHQLMYQNLNTDKLNTIMRQDSLESVVRDPCFLLNEGICNSNIDQTMLSILLFFHRYDILSADPTELHCKQTNKQL